MECIRKGKYPLITHYQDQPFTLPAFGSATPDGAGVITDAVVDGSTTAVLSIPYDDAQHVTYVFGFFSQSCDQWLGYLFSHQHVIYVLKRYLSQS